jgi:hypothetical protein
VVPIEANIQTDGVAVAVGRSRNPGGGRKRAESHDEE